MAETNDMLNLSVSEFLAATAAKQPTPGGGSVAGLVGALAVALGEMSLNFTIGKKKYAEHAEYHEHLSARLAKARTMFAQLIADDVQAYGYYCETNKMPDGEKKDAQMQLALAAAIGVPREMTKLALAVMGDMQELIDKCNKFLLSDLKASATLAAATARLSHYNVMINTPYLDDAQAGKDMLAGSQADLDKATELLAQIETAADAQ